MQEKGEVILMSISGIEATTTANIAGLYDAVKSETIKSSSIKDISDDFSVSDDTLKFKEIVGKYDITNMSRNEANQMYKDLMDDGLIGLKDMIVVFDPTRIPGWQDGESSISGWKISSNADKKMNFLEGLKTQAEWNKIYGDPQFQERFDEKVKLAEKIHFYQS